MDTRRANALLAASRGGGFHMTLREHGTQPTPHLNHAKDPVSSVEICGRIMKVKTGDEEWQFPLVWLRDACTCSSCHEPSSGGRLLKLYEFSPDINIKDVKVRPKDD